MTHLATERAAPALPRAARSPHQPLAIPAVRLGEGGVLGGWQRRNAEATIGHCVAQLESSGVLDNFRRVVGESGAPYRGFVFADSDLYKTIEAVAWEIARSGTDRWDAWLDDVIGLVARVQEPSGYVMTWIQGVHPEKRFAELHWTHEMYVAGHLIQAAVALDRAVGRDDLLRIATAFADLLDRRFGPGREEGVCGHPEIETALVELYRHTGVERYLALAQRMVDLRGRGLLKVGNLGATYFQDHAPVRQARDAVGHAVRQLYLNAGVTDVHLETGEPALLEAMQAQWDSAHHRKMYLTGAFGSRHRDEAFGDDYELPSDRAYAETCATIADVHWSWRMLLATGEPAAYAETIERELHNALAAAVGDDGTTFFYANPLQLRPDRFSEENAPRERRAWYSCACCPPNLARLLAQVSAYVATSTDDELALHLYADAEIDVPAHLGGGVLRVETSYPDDGAVRLRHDGDRPLRLALRVPSWSSRTVLDGAPAEADADGYLRVDLAGAATLELDLAPRWTRAHHRADALRGARAIEVGPRVYCVEQVDLPDDVALDDLVVDERAPLVRADGATVRTTAAVRPRADALYGPTEQDLSAGEVAVVAIPFARWGNRGSSAMRVWLPVV
ncbi:MAG TPA: beta-L-arabinofuranosidase domain-containing protein [Actinotalea caeni]|uniref:glycoside hydrolase family 127 protein n=1 Tax=Actinotalea caeni TaxID=1348467 RepID=UPI002B4B9335|nr:beta-L-arabinofuranosidase domain-containing protein [Actinotalea caeni]HLV55826.1 beta-L-arabinofuranosidase domain-containing protein [Actinotalea caeni]